MGASGLTETVLGAEAMINGFVPANAGPIASIYRRWVF